MHYQAAFLLIFGILSTFGSVWISDEFDAIRMQVYCLALVPATIFFLFTIKNNQEFWHKRPVFFKRIWLALSLLHSWGFILLINAAFSSNKVTIGKVIRQDVSDQTFFTPYRRGGLGHVFRYRF